MYDNFAKLVQKKGVTIYRVAKDTSIAQATLIDWKNGKYTPKIDKLQKLADYFNVTLDYLLGKEDRDESGDLITYDKFSFAMANQSRNLTEDDKEILLSMAKKLAKANRSVK